MVVCLLMLKGCLVGCSGEPMGEGGCSWILEV